MSYTHKMTALPGAYDTAAIEKKWQTHWREAKTYAWNPEIPRADSYVIDTPPPTVSGTLHMGHVYSYTQADFIARFQRMNGKNVFYPMGFDDNGLPTERLVEKTKKVRASDMSREAFIQVCLEVSEEARIEFRALFESIALSVDWDQEYHTVSESSRRLSQLSFLDLVKNGHCYRAQRPFFWDPVDQTAIASAEIEDKELPSNACDIIFTAEGEPLTIMTTRPELLPACVALFCHPEDARYTHLHGREAQVPLFGFSVPILTDVTVEPEKGTGLMMCCTFGDEADIVKWQKHQLPTRVVLNKFGKIDLALALAEGRYPSGFHWPAELAEKLNGKKVSNADAKHPGARQVVIELLKEAGVLIAQKPITHAVKCAERSGAPLEILPTHQWFVKVTDKKDTLTARARECNWNPEWMRLRIEQWIAGLNQDWCISRQRFFGVPFPVWYVTRVTKNKQQVPPETFPVYATADQLPVNPLTSMPPGYSAAENSSDWPEFNSEPESALVQKLIIDKNGDLFHYLPDADVMDTWATSSISPQLSAHGISPELCADPKRFNALFPADLRPQAHEIIRTWAFYTLVKSHLHNASVPWHNLMISGWCLAEDKSKMSKSKGNVVTPVALIEERGTDAVRYWAGTSRLGSDTAFSPDLLKIGKKLVGKLWNATAFAAIHLSKLDVLPTTAVNDTAITETLDRWILSRLHETVRDASDAFARYEYADALEATNTFFWSDFCDNYLELIKKRVYNEDGSSSASAQQSAVRTLYYVLDGILKLYAPFCPHVTEELYSHIFADSFAAKGSLHTMGQWPKVENYLHDAEAIISGADACTILGDIRSRKSQDGKSVKFPVQLLGISSHYKNAERWMDDVCGAGNVRRWEVQTSLGENMVSINLAAEADAA